MVSSRCQRRGTGRRGVPAASRLRLRSAPSDRAINRWIASSFRRRCGFHQPERGRLDRRRAERQRATRVEGRRDEHNLSRLASEETGCHTSRLIVGPPGAGAASRSGNPACDRVIGLYAPTGPHGQRSLPLSWVLVGVYPAGSGPFRAARGGERPANVSRTGILTDFRQGSHTLLYVVQNRCKAR